MSSHRPPGGDAGPGAVPSLPTRAVHGGVPAGSPGDPVVPSLVQSATFFGGGPDDGASLGYTRYGTSPNQRMVADRVAALEGMEAGLALGSGMAAITLSILSMVEAGDHLVSSDQLYGATRLFMEEELPRRGVAVSLVDPDQGQAWEDAIRPETRLLYLETPTNPTLRIFDPRPVAQAGQAHGIPLVMDVTFASPMNFRGGEWGAEMVVHSATKYLGGHSDLIAGVVAGPTDRIEEVRRLLRLYGPALDPHAAWLLDRGMRTLDVRMERHNRNALELAHWFESRPEVARVHYPGLPQHPDHQRALTLLDGFGGMLAVELAGGARAADEFCRHLSLAAVAPSLGGVETLVSLPRLTSHRSMTAQQRASVGISEGLVRISVGIEGLEDLRQEFARALTHVGAGEGPGQS